MHTVFAQSKTLLLAASVLFVLTNCQKDKETEASATDYSPMSAGSTWTYQPNAGPSYTLTTTSRDTVALGRTYKVFTSNVGVNVYQARSANEYYRFGTVPGLSGSGYETLYLKDNQEVNVFWQSTQNITVPGIPLPLAATLKYTIKEKGIARTVNGKNFSDVIHVRLDITVAGFGSVGGGDFYYANKIGLIESSLLISAQGMELANTSEVLTAYSIK